MLLLIVAGSGLGGGSGWIASPLAGVNSCIKVVTNQKASWSQALGICRDMGGYLAALETEAEIFWMKGYRSYHSVLTRHPETWIGGYRKDGMWYWKGDIADTPILAADWGKGQPDTEYGVQDCVALFGDSESYSIRQPSDWYRFDNTQCTTPWPFICEKSLK